MKTFLYLRVLAGILFLISCSGEQDTLKQAHEVHLESAATAQELHKTLSILQNRALPPSQKSRVDSLSQLLDQWQEALLEVPGFEHEHTHEGPHEHKPAPAMTAESMLDYQIQAKEAILSIQMQLEAISL